MEISFEKSKEQADIIKTIAIIAHGLDLEYLKEGAKQLRQQGSFQNSISILSYKDHSKKTELLLLQAKALNSLCEYIENLKEIDRHKKSMANWDAQQDEINNLFM